MEQNFGLNFVPKQNFIWILETLTHITRIASKTVKYNFSGCFHLMQFFFFFFKVILRIYFIQIKYHFMVTETHYPGRISTLVNFWIIYLKCNISLQMYIIDVLYSRANIYETAAKMHEANYIKNLSFSALPSVILRWLSIAWILLVCCTWITMGVNGTIYQRNDWIYSVCRYCLV